MLIKRIIQPLQAPVLSAVVFDLDGTLCHYATTIEQAMVAALQHIGVEATLIGDISLAASRYADLWYELEADHQSTKSLRERIWIRLLQEHSIVDDELARALSEVYIRLRTASLVLFDGVLPLLADLGEKYALGLLTNGPSDLQWEKINLLKIEPLFDRITVSGDMGIHKPDPRLFAGLLEELDAPANRSVCVGNSYQMDIIGAHDAGMWSVWVSSDSEKEPQDSIADLIIADVTELRRVLL